MLLKNESALTKPKTPEKRISLKKAIVFNCFYIMETFLASNFKISTENILRFYKTNKLFIFPGQGTLTTEYSSHPSLSRSLLEALRPQSPSLSGHWYFAKQM